MRKHLVILAVAACFKTALASDQIDSTGRVGGVDSAFTVDTLAVPSSAEDTLLQVRDSAIASFEERYQRFQEQRRRLPSFSYFDSVATHFTSERLNQRPYVDRSFYHDAGHYVRSNPSYFILEHQVTPMRTTVQPFGLSGDRLNFLADGWQLRPFDHVPEPDGMMDLNDVPTALDDAVYILPGAVGLVLGADQTVATLLTRPRKTASYVPEATLQADKGSFGYSFVRGSYSKQFVNGRHYDLSVEYRDADGPTAGRGDDAYHYSGNLFFPVGSDAGVRLRGHVYNRDGNLVVRPEAGGAALFRNRSDRAWRATFGINNRLHTARWKIGYQRTLQDCKMTGAYAVNLGLDKHTAFGGWEWLMGWGIAQLSVTGDYAEYDNGRFKTRRGSGELAWRLAHPGESWRWAVGLGSHYAEGYGILPWGALVLLREWRSFFLLASAGYVERAPTLHELHLGFRKAALYGSTEPRYAECGNDGLRTERQMVGSVMIEAGSPATRLQLAMTGGHIADGIDWRPGPVSDSTGSFILFSPVNGDVTFLDVRVQPQLTLFDILTLSVGGSYRHLDYEAFENRAYSPDYQMFAGAEFHIYWPQRLLDLYAYGEIVYAGPYDGYDERGLGEDPIANAKLSFGLRGFRFNFVFQNVFSRPYESRDYILFPGRYFYYGIRWEFLD